jgi:hypothetical protein
VHDEPYVTNAENRVEMEFRVAQGPQNTAETARRAIEESARRIPDAALNGLKSFRLIVLA